MNPSKKNNKNVRNITCKTLNPDLENGRLDLGSPADPVEPSQIVSLNKEWSKRARAEAMQSGSVEQQKLAKNERRRGRRKNSSETSSPERRPIAQQIRGLARRANSSENAKFRFLQTSTGSSATESQQPKPTLTVETQIPTETTVIATLVEDDMVGLDEAKIREEAQREAEERILSKITRAEIVTVEEDGIEASLNQEKTSSWCTSLCCLVICAIFATAIAVPVTLLSKANGVSLDPITDPPAVPSESPVSSTPTTSSPTLSPTFSLINDVCEGATLVHTGSTIPGSTQKATLDDNVDTCGDIVRNGRGVWYQVVGTGRLMRANTCHGSTGFDTQLSVFSGTDCDRLVCVTGNDQFGSCGDQSAVTWFGEIGVVYYLLVHGFRLSEGEFVLLLDEDDNDECQASIDIDSIEFDRSLFGTTRDLDTNGASPGLPPPGNPALRQFDLWLSTSPPTWNCTTQLSSGTNSGPGKWFTFRGKGSMMRVYGSSLSSDFVPEFAVFSGRSCDALECLFDGALDESDAYLFEDGAQYYLFVKGAFGQTGDFTLSVDGPGAFEVHDSADNAYCESVDDNPENDVFVFNSFASATDFRLNGTVALQGVTGGFGVSGMGSCGDSVFVTSPGLYYSVIGTGGAMTVSTCDTTSGFDTQISVLTGTCDNLVCVDGNDQYCGDHSSVSWWSMKDQLYFIFVHGFGKRSGQFNLTLVDTPSENAGTDNLDCKSAVTIVADGTSILGSTFGSSIEESILSVESMSFLDLCGFSGNSPGVWYKAVGTGVDWTVSTCSSYTNFTARVSVYTKGSSSDCSDMACIQGNVMHSACGDQNAVTWTANAGETYYFFVHGTTEVSSGNFVLTLEETVDNNLCSNAVGALTVDDSSVTFGSTRSSTFKDGDLEIAPECNSEVSESSRAGRGVWYYVIGTGTMMEVSTCTEYTDHNMQLTIFTSETALDGRSCKDLQCVSIDSFPCLTPGYQGIGVQWNSEKDVLYYVFVHGTDDEFGNFGMTISESIFLIDPQ